MILLAIQLDGVLERFGRVVPDALPVLESLPSIRSRSRAVPFDWCVVRFAPSLSQPDARDEAEPAADLARLDLARYVSGSARSVRLAADVDAFLSEPAGDEGRPDRIVVLSADEDVITRAVAAGYEGWQIRESGTPGMRWLPYADVPRMLEESLRIPTARPMGRAARRGTLLAIPVADERDAWAGALEAVRADANADWVTVGEQLFLYTESAELADLLLADANAEILQTDVQVEGLELDVAPLGAVRWSEVRRRSLARGSARAEHAVPVRSPSDLAAGVERATGESAKALSCGPPDAAAALRAALATLVSPCAAPQLITREGSPAALLWTTAPEDPFEEDLAVVSWSVPRLDVGASTTLGLAFGLGLELELRPPRCGVIHCVLLAEDVSAGQVVDGALFEHERGRILQRHEFKAGAPPEAAEALGAVSRLVD